MRRPEFSLDMQPDIAPGTELHPDAETVELPAYIESSLEQHVLPKFIELCRQAGVTEHELTRYQACYKAFSERPTLVERADGTTFEPTHRYFGTHITFDRHLGTMPDVLRNTSYKLRTAELPDAATPINADEILEQFIAAIPVTEQPKPENLEGTPETSVARAITNYEKFLTQINRLSYRLHESLHIYQSLVIGDLLNRLKNEYGAKDVIDPEKEKQLVRRNSVSSFSQWEFPDWVNQSVLVKKEKLRDQTNLGVNPQISNNEATMDIVSEWMLEEEIKKHPDFVLWMHNTLAHLYAGLKRSHDLMLQAAQADQWQDIPSYGHTHLYHALDMIYPAYFAAFSSSARAANYLRSQKFTIGHAPARGHIASGENFSAMDIINIQSEIRRLENLLQRRGFATDNSSYISSEKLADKIKNTITFPSGKSYLADNHSEGPTTQEGAELATQIIEACTTQGFSADQVSILFRQIQEAIADESTIETLRQQYPAEISAFLTSTNIQEMRNIARYVHFNDIDNANFPFQRAVRKSAMTRLKTTHRDQINPLIAWTFFEAPYEFDVEDIFFITGFGIANNSDHSMIYRTKAEIFNDTNLGLFNINVPALSEKQRARLFNLIPDNLAELSDKKYHPALIQELVTLAKEQRETK